MSPRFSLTRRPPGAADDWFAGDEALLWLFVMLLFAALVFWWGWSWGDWW